jgi:hypothetical protein
MGPPSPGRRPPIVPGFGGNGTRLGRSPVTGAAKADPELVVFPLLPASFTSDLAERGLLAFPNDLGHAKRDDASAQKPPGSRIWRASRGSRQHCGGRLAPLRTGRRESWQSERVQLGQGFIVGSIELGGIVFACTFGGAVAGMFLRTVVPEHHLSPESKDVVKLGTGLIATLSALVLGLLIASAKSSFDAQRSGFQQLSANLVLLDRTLARYGPETKAARESLRSLVASTIQRLWPDDASQSSGLGASAITTGGGAVFDQVGKLSPKNETQRSLQSQAVQICNELSKTRWLLTEEDESAIPRPFLVVVVSWLTMLFVSFGLFSPPNPTVIVTLLVCALSVAGAMFLIVDLDEPFGGLIQISSTSLRNALAQLGQ